MQGCRNLPHLRLTGPSRSIHFTSVPQKGASLRLPPRNREEHASSLLSKLETAWSQHPTTTAVGHPVSDGIYLEFRSSPGFDLKIKSLEDFHSKKVRLCNVRKKLETFEENGQSIRKETTLATVFVAHEKRDFFFDRIREYADQETRTNRPKHADLVVSIADLQKAVLQSFWVDDTDLMPTDVPKWIEVWLRGDSEAVDQIFSNTLQQLGIPYRPGKIVFPERTVRLVHADSAVLSSILDNSSDIAEFRLAKTTADFWANLTSGAQADWVTSLAERIHVNREAGVSICLLDSGVTQGHPLISPFLAARDCLCIRSEWGAHDHKGHGTKMAGTAAYGHLQSALEGTGDLTYGYCLESVKILPPPPEANAQALWGDITAQGVSIAEINAPDRKRIHCMAVMASDTRDKGRPTSWSSAIDKLAAGAEDSTKRLFVLSAGNSDIAHWGNYPDAQLTDSIHDPGQAWNALTVGAYTQLTTITEPTLSGFRPIASEGELSPFSTTSLAWQRQWPIKPEVVFEGGNAIIDSSGFVSECEDLAIVTTNFRPTEGLLTTFSMTSAASAQAASFAAAVQQAYPEYWPETVRALVVHSANWPRPLINQFAPNETKTEIQNLIRCCGYGVPDLDRALWCASNSLTLVVEATIQPYELVSNPSKSYKTKDMHLYKLPWPIEQLRDLGETSVEMRITLSYFVEPGPGEVGWKDRYRYPSHLLRFELNSPGESEDEFVRRINAAVRDDESGHPGTQSPTTHWVIGSHARDKGSIHSDIWRGTAVELAGSSLIGISPRIGWWRERTHLERFASETRYALIVSITTPSTEVDIYASVAQIITANIPIDIR
jgi:hypothetical protein